jgi:hypothetical protein
MPLRSILLACFLSGLTGAIAANLLTRALENSKPKDLQVTSLTLVDAAGNPTGSWRVGPNGEVAIRLTAAAGINVVELTGNSMGGRLTMRSPGQDDDMLAAQVLDGVPMIFMRNRHNQTRLQLGGDAENQGFMGLHLFDGSYPSVSAFVSRDLITREPTRGFSVSGPGRTHWHAP